MINNPRAIESVELMIIKLLWFVLFLPRIYATDYFVATSYGNDSNNGTSLTTPFKTIGKAATVMSAGDNCYIRQGRYHETISVNNLDGLSGAPIVFTNYNSERVIIDGTKPITSSWIQVGSSNIWRTKLSEDIWQLFLDWEEQVMARWPNAKFSDNTIWDNDNYWAKGTIDDNASAYSNGAIIDDPYINSAGTTIDLSAAGFDLDETNKQAIAILNVGSFRTWSRLVTSHSGNTFNYATVPNWKTKHHYYYFEGRREFLDQAGEWWYDTFNDVDSLYYYADNGVNPNRLDFRGKVQSYAFSFSGSQYIHIKNLEFFGTTVYFSNGDNCLIYGCNFMYPSCSKRMLRIVDTEPEMTKFASNSSNSIIRRSAFRNTDGIAVEMWGGDNRIDSTYFNHIDYSVADNSGLMVTIRMNGSDNIFSHNTVHRTGASATLWLGSSPLVEYNDLYDTGHLQSDGSMVQIAESEQDGAICRYNWLHDTEKYGARFDHSGTADGTNGIMHHNLAWNCESGGIMVKGNNHKIYNNTVLSSGSRNDIIVLQINDGDHSSTIIRNNAADKISNHRTNDVAIDFGTYSNNWNGYDESGTLNSMLTDTSNNNFSPGSGSALIDAGIAISGITDQYTNNGSAPDIGAYEDGNTDWTAGHDWNVNTTFGSSWIPVHSTTISGNSGFRMMSSPVSGTIMSDLLDELWIQGMTGADATSGNANVWLLDLAGQAWSAVSNLSSQSLAAGQGFLVYIFDDIDFDGDSDLSVDLYISGTPNNGDITISSIPENNYYLAGNPYVKTIDWDYISKSNLSSSVSVWDDANSSWKTYNGSAGDLTNGLIAPFQGFWVQAVGGTGSFTIQLSDISNTAGSFIGRTIENDSSGYVSITTTLGEEVSRAYLTFAHEGDASRDIGDAEKLLPLKARSCIATMTIIENSAYKINNLPLYSDSVLRVPIDVLVLSLDSLNHFISKDQEVNLNFNLENLPDLIYLSLFDNINGIEYDLYSSQEITIITESKGSFSAIPEAAVQSYPVLGEPRLILEIHYSNMMNREMEHLIPKKFKLYPLFPNPFNPTGVIRYDIPKNSNVRINVYDLRGRLVKKLIHKYFKPGSYNFNWSPVMISSGIYILRMEAEGKIFCQKITYIK